MRGVAEHGLALGESVDSHMGLALGLKTTHVSHMGLWNF